MDRASFSGSSVSDPPGETTLLPAEHSQHTHTQEPMRLGYVPTEEERKVFKECNQESFWYRSVPISVSSMALTQFLISRGTLTASTRFGSVPKVLFAGMCGYFAGKLSYMKTCQEKFKRLENSPLGDALRQSGQRLPYSPGQSEFQSDSQRDTHFSSDSSQNTHSSDYPQLHAGHADEEDVQKKRISYEDLRNTNRENFYEVLQKTDLKTPAESSPPKTQVKKNVYGDTWEE